MFVLFCVLWTACSLCSGSCEFARFAFGMALSEGESSARCEGTAEERADGGGLGGG